MPLWISSSSIQARLCPLKEIILVSCLTLFKLLFRRARAWQQQQRHWLQSWVRLLLHDLRTLQQGANVHVGKD